MTEKSTFFTDTTAIIKKWREGNFEDSERSTELLMRIVFDLSDVYNSAMDDSRDLYLPHRRAAEVALANAVINVLDLASRFDINLDAAWPKWAPDFGTFNQRGELLADATLAKKHGLIDVGLITIISNLLDAHTILTEEPPAGFEVILPAGLPGGAMLLANTLLELVTFAAVRGYDLDVTMGELLGEFTLDTTDEAGAS
jgi:hypothetical protein